MYKKYRGIGSNYWGKQFLIGIRIIKSNLDRQSKYKSKIFNVTEQE